MSTLFDSFFDATDTTQELITISLPGDIVIEIDNPVAEIITATGIAIGLVLFLSKD